MSRTAPEQCEESRIRPVDPLHVADLIRIGEETNLSPWSAQSYLEEMKNPHAILLRMVNDRQPNIGFVVGRLVMAGDTESATDAEVYNIAVVSTEQRRGCGQSLFEAFRNDARNARSLISGSRSVNRTHRHCGSMKKTAFNACNHDVISTKTPVNTPF